MLLDQDDDGARNGKIWLAGILGGVLGGILAAAIFLYVHDSRTKAAIETSTRTAITNADALLKKNMIPDALSIYRDLLKEVSELREPERYGHILYYRGLAYYKLALAGDREDNLARSIQSFEEALRVYSSDGYAVDRAKVQNDLGSAYSLQAEIQDKEKNLAAAVNAFEQALQTFSPEKY
ncbi:MAG: hypothetical protein HQK56_12545, partial [Deltaproteobacteria bacterium]|nr:hypothetical protein [Deltaproteobacteria bacterium]